MRERQTSQASLGRNIITTYLVTVCSSKHFPRADSLVPSIRSLNRTMWLKLLSAARNAANACPQTRFLEMTVLHAAASLEFYKLMKEEIEHFDDKGSRNQMLLSMGRQFLGSNVLTSVARRGRGETLSDQVDDSALPLDIVLESSMAFMRALLRLAPFNISLHTASWVISHGMRGRMPTLASFASAMKGAIALNLVVASSCWIWSFAGLSLARFKRLRNTPKLRCAVVASLIPLPLHGIRNKVVRASFFFLYIPWAVRSLLGLSKLRISPKVAFGIGALMTSLVPPELASSDWLVSVAFRVAQREILKYSRFGRKEAGA